MKSRRDANVSSNEIGSCKMEQRRCFVFMGLVHATLALPWPCISVLDVVLVLAANVGGPVVPC